ncbi:DegT/DnrJ/EryC1/StrS family aminotransferase [Fusobacterium ulcerans]|jgi:dTDP-4-amino-4,6-dideoxygalactose transaminase|uniref:DegT/DnrJ/EryC1/StrS family aminotransferase n=1 Tax=Fusobacterium ulcerans TaxID=861 RepID=UPI000E53150C|nr:DegT/DnrJ/EryC1/StrS family aminotransferase [Fusobacterium ulcerans]RGY63027.1 DegT/DnrJ/EryC1/StrS family aminotransferase [Fusobacterium ulcerans]
MDKLNKKIMVTKSFLPPYEEYCEEIKEIWNTYWLTNMGIKHETLKEKMKKYLDVKNITLCSNGHLALEMAIRALKLTGEVITTPYTFASTTHAITRCGLTPVFCDIEMESFTIDISKIEELITEKTSAIIPVHVYGNPCNVEEIEKIAKKHNLKVIYDAAHTFGVEINGRGIGNYGDVSMFSLHATKVYSTIEGGALTYNNDDYSALFRLEKNFGITGPEEVIQNGGNAKLNEFQAAMGLVNLKYVDSEILKRKKLVEKYRELLNSIEGIRYLEDIKGIRHNYAYFPIIIDEKIYGKTRDEVFEKLKDYNIFTRKYFYPLINNFECYKEKYKDIKLPNAKYVSDRVMTLPMYGDLTLEEVEYICKTLKEIKKDEDISYNR